MLALLLSADALYLLCYLLVGMVTGVLAGLFGVGGGTIIVPVLVIMFGWQHVPAAYAMHLALGSSLAVISFTAISSVRAHHERGAVDWRIFLQLTPAVCVGVAVGAVVASHLSGATLKAGFAIFLLAIALQMAFNLQPAVHRASVTPWRCTLVGVVIGFLSALFGIGGGSLSVPFLSWHGVRMQRAVATAAAVGLPLAIVGAATYGWRGWDQANLPAWHTGFLYWPAILGIAASSIIAARLGARLAHELDPLILKRAFALFLFAIGVWFLIRG